MIQIAAEFSYNHGGNPDVLKEMSQKALESGADLIKVELRNNGFYYRNYPDLIKSRGGRELDDLSLRWLTDFCHKNRMNWLASVHDIDSLKKLLTYQPYGIKVASREAHCWEFLKKLDELVPDYHLVMVSTGGLNLNEIHRIYDLLKHKNLMLLHTVSKYPCEPELLNMSRINYFKKQFKCKVGYSGHEQGFYASIYAAVIGVDYIERHFKLKNQPVIKGDSKFKDELCTLDPDQFKQMTDGIRIMDIIKNSEHRCEPDVGEIDRLNYYGKISWDSDVFVR